MNDEERIAHGVRRTVGIATLRRLRRMITAERQDEVRDTRFAVWLGAACALALVLTVAWMTFR